MDEDRTRVSPSFDALLEGAIADEDAARASRAGRAEDAADAGETTQLERAAPPDAPSRTPISASAVALIIAFEVTSQAVYERRYRAPIWPRGASGVTIGIGYDLGHVDAAQFDADWGGSLDAGALARLSSACGVTGEAAGALAGGFADIAVPWADAERVFRTTTLPRYTGLTERSLPNTAVLNGDCLGALVSLVYNRGASFRREGDRFREMRAILGHAEARRFAAIPDEMRAMRRIWRGDPAMAGLLRRREAEAALFERGLEMLLAPSNAVALAGSEAAGAGGAETAA